MPRSSSFAHFPRFHELRHAVGDARALWIAPLWMVARRYEVIARDLGDLSDLPAASTDYSCHGLQSTSPAQLANFDRRLSVTEIERRLEEGQICEVWRYDHKIVHFRWLSTTRTLLPFLAIHYQPSEGDCLLFEVFTLADRRSRGMHSSVAAHSLRQAREKGFRRVVALCAWWNAPALRVAEKFGFESVGTVTRWQLGPWSVYTTTGEVAVSGRHLLVLGSRTDRGESSRAGAG